MNENRSILERELVAEIGFNPHIKKALLFIEIDDLNDVNQTLGPIFGEKLKNAIENRISSLLSDTQKLYDFSTDSFLLFMKDYRSKKEVMELALLICQSFKQAFDVDGFKIRLSEKIGIVLYPEHKKNAAEMLNQVVTVFYKGKREGRQRIWFCDHRPEVDFKNFMITQDLYKASSRKELTLFYQPQWDLNADKISGFEALLRWKHQKFGYISPSTFIPMAEKTGLIIPIGEQVLIDACLFLKKLHHRGYEDITVSVNVSGVQLLDEGFYEDVIRIVDFIGLNPSSLVLEITETVLMRELEYVAGGLRRLRNKGIEIAIDDFGQGYSSLAYIKKIPADILKIDKIFADDILEFKDDNRPLLIDSIVSMGKNMDFKVMAEGIETKFQMEHLKKNGCHMFQGYYLSKPVSEDGAHLLLEQLNGGRERRII